jgi:hypothetical protein
LRHHDVENQHIVAAILHCPACFRTVVRTVHRVARLAQTGSEVAQQLAVIFRQ